MRICVWFGGNKGPLGLAYGNGLKVGLLISENDS